MKASAFSDVQKPFILKQGADGASETVVGWPVHFFRGTPRYLTAIWSMTCDACSWPDGVLRQQASCLTYNFSLDPPFVT